MKLFYRKTRWIRAAVAFLIIFAVCECALFGLVWWRALAADAPEQAGVIIVLGCGIDENDGTPRATLALRLDRAAELYHEGYAPTIIVSGGQGVDEPVPEAQSMRDYLIDIGIPEDVIIMEDESGDTAENMAFSKAIMGERGYETAIIVTSDYHMWRALRIAKDAGLSATGAASKNSDSLVWSIVNLARETLGWLQYGLKV